MCQVKQEKQGNESSNSVAKRKVLEVHFELARDNL